MRLAAFQHRRKGARAVAEVFLDGPGTAAYAIGDSRHFARVLIPRRERIASAKGGLMYPGFIPHWKRSRCGEARWVGAGSGRHFGRESWGYRAAEEEDAPAFSSGGGSFGVRRPLRFLAYKLDLQDAQVA